MFETKCENLTGVFKTKMTFTKHTPNDISNERARRVHHDDANKNAQNCILGTLKKQNLSIKCNGFRVLIIIVTL